MNSAVLYRRIQTYCRSLQKSLRNDERRLERVYMEILSRLPTDEERQEFLKYQKSLDAKSQSRALLDTVWILFNSKEFVFHH